MSTSVPRPYGQFNFQVVFSNGSFPQSTDPKAGFQEISGLTMEVHMAEYRNGNYGFNNTMQIPGLTKYGPVTFKRGLIGDTTTIYGWINSISLGNTMNWQTVTVQQMDETGQNVVQQWKLINARPTKYVGPTLSGKGTDISIEEMTLSVETITQLPTPATS